MQSSAASYRHARPIADGIYQVRLPLPFALNHVNCYLLREADGWTVLDAGLNWPAARDGWRAAMAELGFDFHDIRRIVLTHMHPDHFGLSGWFQAQSEQTVYLSPREAELAQDVWVNNSWRPERMDDYWRMGGITPEVAAVVSSQTLHLREMTLPHPAQIALIPPGARVEMGGRRWLAIHAPGHSDGQLIFYNEGERLMLSGDQVLMKITPNIGLWPSTEADPLGRFLVSLRELMQLDVRLALPGHGPLIDDWDGRLRELFEHHIRRTAHTYAAIGPDGATALTVSHQLFDYAKFTQHEVRFALAETLAHLEYLVAQGELRRAENGVRLYARA